MRYNRAENGRATIYIPTVCFFELSLSKIVSETKATSGVPLMPRHRIETHPHPGPLPTGRSLRDCPQGEAASFALRCDQWVSEGDAIVPGLKVMEMHGSKTPSELALVLEDTTVITGDLIRSHAAGSLCLLPDGKLTDKQAALASVERIVRLAQVEAVLVSDGWPVFRDGAIRLQEMWAKASSR